MEVGPAEGVRKPSAIRCDFLTLMFKRKLARRVGALSFDKQEQVDRALAIALDLAVPYST